MGESVADMVWELHRLEPIAVGYCDVSIVSFDAGSWRTWHLRVRAHALRERISDAPWGSALDFSPFGGARSTCRTPEG